mmetsp:Transcript_10723/g.66106  ORF Transcript_10723/g.66106 Transcript_10723/m.66106 type:complete len:140 (+) Transcript_10723:2526-2945(+)
MLLVRKPWFGIDREMNLLDGTVKWSTLIRPPCYCTVPLEWYFSVLTAQEKAQTAVLAHRWILWRGPIETDVLNRMAQGHVPTTPALCNSCLYFDLMVARSDCVAKLGQHSIEPSSVTSKRWEDGIFSCPPPRFSETRHR